MASIQIEEYKRHHDGKICTRARIYWRQEGKQKARTLWSAPKPRAELSKDERDALERAIASVGKGASISQAKRIERATKREVKDAAIATKAQLSRESAIRRYQDKVQRYRRARIRMSETEKQQWAGQIGCTIEELEDL